MASCEKCWKESGGDPFQYEYLLRVRQCTPEEQAGEDATICGVCKRKTVHQHSHCCMNNLCTVHQVKEI